MWRNYLTVGLRALAKHRAYAAINILGLAIGLAASLMILLYVRYETTYDHWMPEADRAYQLQTWFKAGAHGGGGERIQLSAIVAAKTLARDFPQVENAVFVRSFSPIVVQDGQPREVERLRMVDGNLFDILRVPFVRGDARTALPDAHSVALSESEARRRFGSADPMGKPLTIADNAGDVGYRVTAVFKDLPRNASFSADMVARFDPAVQFADRTRTMTDWDTQQGWNYIRLRPGARIDDIARQLPAWEKRRIPDKVFNGERTNAGDTQDYHLVDIRDVHLGRAQQYPVTPGNDRGTVFTFAVVALLVLAMACVNFTNLATARASQRAREVALRKVLGATRRQLIVQFIGESVLVAALAMLVALAAVEILLPAFNRFLNADIALRYVGTDGILLPAIVLVLLVGLVGGLYPAVFLSRFEPSRILKANKSAAEAQGSGRLRNALVIGQFAVSIGLIVCTAVIYAQTTYAQTMDAGFRRHGLLQVGNLGFKGATDEMARALVERVRRVAGVEAAALTQIGVSPTGNSASGFFLPGATRSVQLGQYGVDVGFFRAMGMKLLAGRDFSRAVARDDATTPNPPDLAAERAFAARGVNLVVTRLAAERLGFKSPQAAIGAGIKAELSLPEVGLVPATIVGVVEDARLRSLREPVQPSVFVLQNAYFSQMAVRFANVPPREIRERIEAIWRQIVPGVPFRADFADDLVREQYGVERARGQLFAGFALLSVMVGCLGLFGLAAFTAERRTKEIGIRKVLGASSGDIVRLLVWQFSRPVLLANIIAWPVAWWVMRGWLNGFDARIALTPLPFLAASALALVIAIATIGTQALRVARTSPVRALRYE